MKKAKLFFNAIVVWQQQYGRHHLPWLKHRRFYDVWVSEVMLQQTQVNTVIPYFTQFVQRFPDVTSLAVASENEVLALWSGLGFYRRARYLHATARLLVQKYDGKFPHSVKEWIELPGIGKTTAHAILSSVLGKPLPILDGNVKRILTRYFNFPSEPASALLWEKITALIPKTAGQIACFNQGLMDLGASVCKKGHPDCGQCPLKVSCSYNPESLLSTRKSSGKPAKAKRNLTMFWIEQNGKLLLLPVPKDFAIWQGLYFIPMLDWQIAFPLAKRLQEKRRYCTAIKKHACSHLDLEGEVSVISLSSLEKWESISEVEYWAEKKQLACIGVPSLLMKLSDGYLEKIKTVWR